MKKFGNGNLTLMEVIAMYNEETKRKPRELNIGELISAIEFQQQDSTTVLLI